MDWRVDLREKVWYNVEKHLDSLGKGVNTRSKDKAIRIA